MIFVIGGCASGKTHYIVNNLGYSLDDISDGELCDLPVIENIDKLATEKLDTLVEKLSKKEVVSCNEVGSGVVPIDAQQRKLREDIGKLCVMLSKEATMVIRMTCGIPTRIK